MFYKIYNCGEINSSAINFSNTVLTIILDTLIDIANRLSLELTDIKLQRNNIPLKFN